MIIADLEHVNSVSEVKEIEGGNMMESLATVLGLLSAGLPFAANNNSNEYLTLGAFASFADQKQEYLATSVGTSRISSGKYSLTQIAFG